MKFANIIHMYIAIFVVLIMTSCGGTRMTDHWQAEGFSKRDLDKVLVVAVTTNTMNRVLFEDSLAQTLREDGIEAHTSYQVIGKENLTRDAVVAYVKNHDIKFVLATKLDNVKVNTDYVPASSVTYYTGPYYPTYHYYWENNSYTVTNEAYTDVQTIVMLVTTIYDAKTEAPVWMGHSATYEMNAIAGIGNEIARATLRNMSR